MHNERCSEVESDTVDLSSADVYSRSAASASIESADIFQLQADWARGIVEIGTLYSEGGDYVGRAQTLVESLYGYCESPVLFKPTLAFRRPFRVAQNEATSYFIGGVVDEDLGFALRPWARVRFGPQRILLQGATAVAMGHYVFFDANTGHEIQAEFTLGFFRSNSGAVKINVHHSSLPYASPQ